MKFTILKLRVSVQLSNAFRNVKTQASLPNTHTQRKEKMKGKEGEGRKEGKEGGRKRKHKPQFRKNVYFQHI